MNRRIGLACAAAVGCALLVYAVPRAHPAKLWNITVDRQESIVKARDISAAFGVNTASWQVVTAASSSERRQYYAVVHPGDPAAKRFSCIYPQVAFAAPNGQDRVFVELSGNGDVNLWEHKGYRKSAATDPEQARRIALDALRRMAGPDAAAFHSVTDASQTGTSLTFAWEQAGGFTQRFQATVDGGVLAKAELTAVYNGALDEARREHSRHRDWFEIIGLVLVFAVGVALALGTYIYWSARRAVHQRFVFALTGLAAVWALIAWFNWTFDDQTYDALVSGERWINVWLNGFGLFLGLIVLFVAVSGGMDAVTPGSKLATLRSLFTSSALNRRLGFSALAGLLCGPLLAGLPLLFSSLSILHPQISDDLQSRLIYSLSPGLQAIDVPIDGVVMGIFGVLGGLLARWIRNGKVAFAILFVAGTLALVDRTPPSDASPAVFFASAISAFLILHQLFFRFDMLAALMAAYCARVIFNAGALLLQPARSLHVSGITALSYLAALTLCAGLVAWRGRRLEIEESTSADRAAQSQRETLMAEFSIAHRVQQHMLPDNPPAIPGFSIAASCQPAREVGGDLFDFLKLPDGRWTISVGDVSGKGVPAALYMTLTKGLLIATTQDCRDLLDMIANVNFHIHEVTERKTFVTMAVGVLDPETLCFDHVRAGHNPIVWRSPSQNATSFLNSPGIGLGMVPDRLFRRSTRVDRVQLSAGDLLVFYSDGLTEAMNRENEQFGEQRLRDVVERVDGLDAAAAREKILGDVTEFLDGVAPQDDMTIVVVRVN